MSSSNKTTTSSPDKPSGNPPGIPSDKEPPSIHPTTKETPSGKPGNPVTKSASKPARKPMTPKATPSGKPLGFVDACLFNSSDDEDPPPFRKKDLIVLLNKRDPFPKHLKVAFLKDFTRKNILALVENSAKSHLLKIRQDCYHSMGAKVSSMNRNWGISYVAKQLGAIILTFHEYKSKPLEMVAYLNGLESMFTKELKKVKAKEIAARDVKIGKLTKPWKKTGQRPQDFQTCPQCDHFNTMELQPAKEVEQINKQLEDEHQTEMLHWENKLVAVKLNTRKPRKKPQERQIACYCHNIHCMLETSGGVCYRCRGYVKDGKDLPLNQTGKACKCEPDAEKAVVGGASVFLSYVEGKIDSRVNEQYLANPFATKADHLQNAHATAFLAIISDPVLGSVRLKKTLEEAMDPLQTTSKDGKTIDQLSDEKRGVKSEPSSDSRTNGPARFPCNRTMKKEPKETPMNTLLEIGSYREPITIDGDTEDSKPRPRTLIRHTPSRNQGPPRKDKTPAFVWSVCRLAFKKADFQMNSQDTQDILDFVGPKLTYKDDSEVIIFLLNPIR
eukprot:jgi/Psemu1/1617/gm1.1617_g